MLLILILIIHLSVLASSREGDSPMLFASGKYNGFIFGIEVSSELHVAYFVKLYHFIIVLRFNGIVLCIIISLTFDCT